jgi:hypothetical protein
VIGNHQQLCGALAKRDDESADAFAAKAKRDPRRKSKALSAG